MRSVKSEAYNSGSDSAAPVGARVVSGHVDDLKRIRGIGVLIERRLNSLGVTQYAQMANWSAPDVEKVSQALDFKGRIERETLRSSRREFWPRAAILNFQVALIAAR